jgi:hypothetical protein
MKFCVKLRLEREGVHTRVLWDIHKGRGYLEYIYIGGMIILRWIRDTGLGV